MRRDRISTQAFYVSVGKMLRGFRVMERMSAVELGRRVGISERHIWRIETGRARCALHILVAIAHELDLSLDFDVFPVTATTERKSA